MSSAAANANEAVDPSRVIIPATRMLASASNGTEDPAQFEWNEFVLDMIAVARALIAERGELRVELGVGHSFAGTCMMAAATRHPDLFGRIAALDPVLYPPRGESPGLATGRVHPMAETARRRRTAFDSRQGVRERWAERGTFGDWDPRTMDLYLERGFRDLPDGRVELKCSGETEARVYEAGPRLDVFTETAGLRTPVNLYFAARGERPRALVERLAASSESIEIEPIDAGHLLPMIVPDLIAEKLLAER